MLLARTGTHIKGSDHHPALQGKGQLGRKEPTHLQQILRGEAGTCATNSDRGNGQSEQETRTDNSRIGTLDLWEAHCESE